MSTRIALGAIAALALVCSGCGSSDTGDTAAASSAPAAVPAATAAASPESDFCDLYATQVAQGLGNLTTAAESGVAAENIAAELAAKAPVSQAELQAVAPPEPLGYLQAIESADADGAAGDLSGMDALFPNLVSLTDWSLANCDAKYAPVFTEYKSMIG